jgi:hypothetical protein
MQKKRYLIIAALVAAILGICIQVFGGQEQPLQKQPTKDRTESLSYCKLSKETVTVKLSSRRYPHATGHIREAVSHGKPTVLHLQRTQAKTNRRKSLRNIPTRPGYDRDEYPPASTREGGQGAHVRYVIPRENRGAGATMRKQLATYCDGQKFRIQITQH